MKFQNRLVCAALAVIAAAASGCSKAQNPTSITILPEEVGNGGCLSVQKLLDRIRSFPEDTQARIFSRDVSIKAPENARSRFLELLARGAFKFEEGGLRHLTRYDLGIPFDSASQAQCGAATLYNDESNGQEYQITRSTPTGLTLEQPDKNVRLDIELTGPNELRLRYNYAAVDVCMNELQADVETTQILTWEVPGVPLNSEERVSTGMLKRLAPSLVLVPQGIQSALSGSGEPEIALAVTDLRELRNSEVSTDALACFPPPPPREDEQ